MNKRVLVTWFVSYIIIMMIPMTVSGIVYNRSVRTIESETMRANSAMLRQLKQVYDKEMQDITNVGIQMSLDHRLISIMSDENINNQSKIRLMYDDLSELQRVIKSYKISNALIKEFYIFFNSNDLVLTDSSFGNSEQLFNTTHTNGEMSYNTWKEIMQKRYENFFEILPVYYGGYSLALMRSLPAGDISKVSANIVILLDKSIFCKTVENITLLGKGSTFILDSQDNMLFSSGTENTEEYPNYKSLNQPGKAEIINRKNISYAALFEKSDIADWKYVSILPYTIFNQKAKQAKQIIYVGVAICIIIGSLAAFLLAKRNYNPVNDIVRILAEKAGIPFNKEYNEFRFISDAVTNTLNQNDDMNKKLKQQNVILKSNMLTKLLKGRATKSELLLESLKSLGVEFLSDDFAVVVFYLEEYSELFIGENSMDETEKLKLVYFIITNTFKEMIGDKHRVFTTEIDNMLACIVNFNDSDPSEYIKSLRETTEKSLVFLNEKLYILFSVSISDIHHTTLGIAQCYQESMDAMEHKILSGNGKIILYEDIKKRYEREVFYNYGIDMEQKLLNCIRVGDFPNAKNLLEEVFRQNLSDNEISIYVAKCIMFDLAGTFLKSLDKAVYSDGNMDFASGRFVRDLLKCETIEKLKEQMINMLEVFCNASSNRNNNGHDRLIESVLEIIKTSYIDANINIVTIADKLGMNPKYLSGVFKETTGKSILDVINMTRIDKAKSLLKENEMSIAIAAVEAGYYDSKALIRAFKKYEGITPGQYREKA